MIGKVSKLMSKRTINTWRPVPQLEGPASVDTFKRHALHAQKPMKLPAGSVPINAAGTWLTKSEPPKLNTAYLQRFASTLYLPMELSVAGDSSVFHRADAAPLSLFLDAWEQRHTSDLKPRFYIAQSPLPLLPAELAAAFPTPDVVTRAGAGDVYASSLWLGRPPTATPLHRDPNPNVFAQAAGSKVVRLLPPNAGARVYARVVEAGLSGGEEKGGGGVGGGGGGFGANERFRGEGMMKGREKEALEHAVWGDENEKEKNDEGEGDGFEAVLHAGDALFIPLGWWHAVRGVGEGVNMSVNWWFR